MKAALGKITADLNQQAELSAKLQNNHDNEMRIIVSSHSTQITIETSPVTRGTLHPSLKKTLVNRLKIRWALRPFKSCL